jgi:hypothetical protein
VKLVAAILVLTASSALAQHRGFARSHRPFSGFGSNSGFGNVVFPGTGRAPVGSITDPGFSARLGATVGGWLNYKGVAPPVTRGGRGPVYVPFVWPAYGGYVNPYMQQQPNVIVIQQPPAPAAQQQTPQVVINNYADPNARPYEPVTTYQAPARQPVAMDAAAPAYYLIAFKDNTIYSAVAYWVEGDTLHYVTNGNVRNQVSLDLVDTELTSRLNKDRNVSVKLK